MSWILLLTRKLGEAYAAQLVRFVMQRAAERAAIEWMQGRPSENFRRAAFACGITLERADGARVVGIFFLIEKEIGPWWGKERVRIHLCWVNGVMQRWRVLVLFNGAEM